MSRALFEETGDPIIQETNFRIGGWTSIDKDNSWCVKALLRERMNHFLIIIAEDPFRARVLQKQRFWIGDSWVFPAERENYIQGLRDRVRNDQPEREIFKNK